MARRPSPSEQIESCRVAECGLTTRATLSALPPPDCRRIDVTRFGDFAHAEPSRLTPPPGFPCSGKLTYRDQAR